MEITLIREEPRSLLGEKLDQGIEPIVLYLNKRGVGTIMSCDGHGREFPWVLTEDVPVEKIAGILSDLGMDGGFTVEKQFIFTRRNVARVALMLQFWCLPNEFKRVVAKAHGLLNDGLD